MAPEMAPADEHTDEHMSQRVADPIGSWLRGLRPGEQSQRMLYLAWPAMLRLLTKARKPERERCHGYFRRLAKIEYDTTMSESERGKAFLALHKEAWPVRGRPRDDNNGFLANFTEIRDMLALVWPKGKAARAAAVAAVERRIIPDEFGVPFELEDVDRSAILALRTPRAATLRLLTHVYGDEDTNALTQILKRARRRSPPP
jgi:hypothetical protein